MPMTVHALLAASLLLSAAGEPSKPPPATADAPPASAPLPPTAPSPAAPAPVPTPTAAPLREAVALEPAGNAIPLGREPETVVDPAASFRVELAVSLADARLVLLDGQDAHVAASAAQEVGPTTRLTLAPAAPLTPGSRYTLRIEGASRREVHDAAGKAYAPLSVVVLAAGSPPPAEPKRKPARKGRAR
jgi:hypothetical protein